MNITYGNIQLLMSWKKGDTYTVRIYRKRWFVAFFLFSLLSLDWRFGRHAFDMLPSRSLAQTRLYRFLRKELTIRF